MKIIKRTVLKNGTRRLVVEVPENETLLGFDDDGYYRLGYPVGDVVAGRHIVEAAPVTWCSVEQRWVE